MKTFKSDELGFSISYPDSWQVVPSPWAKQFMGQARNTSAKMAEYLATGSPPFLIVHDPQVQQGIAVPGLKCQAYSSEAISAAGGVPAIFSSILGHMQQAFPDFVLHDISTECVVAGVVGGRLTASMSVLNLKGESFHGLTELLFLPTSMYTFSVGLTATSDLSHRPEGELADIKRSIRLL